MTLDEFERGKLSVHAAKYIADLEAKMTLTEPEVVAAIFAVSSYLSKAKRDGDLLRQDHKEAVETVWRKLREELDRIDQSAGKAR